MHLWADMKNLPSIITLKPFLSHQITGETKKEAYAKSRQRQIDQDSKEVYERANSRLQGFQAKAVKFKALNSV
ncbi:hypothetical protein ACTXT7_015876 [Hymenolepis weldensis]